MGLVFGPYVLPSEKIFEVLRLDVHDTQRGVCPLVDYDVRLDEAARASIEYTLLRASPSGEYGWVDSGSQSRNLYDTDQLPEPLTLRSYTANEIACPTVPGKYLLLVRYELERPSRWAPAPRPIRVVTEPFIVN